MGSTAQTSNTYGLRKQQIQALHQVTPGDHLARENKAKLYWHHVIVEEVDHENQTFTVIHYTNTVRGGTRTFLNDGSLAEVRRDTLEFYPGRYYRIVYNNNDNVYSPETVLELARNRLGEKRYQVLTNNCEHFCTECKIGQAASSQVKTFVYNCVTTLVQCLLKCLVESCLPEKASKQAVRYFLRGAIPASASSFRKTASARSFRKTCGPLVAAICELVLATKDIIDAWEKKESGEISQEEFEECVITRIVVALVSYLFSIGGGLIGQLILPCPMLGNIFGTIGGNVIGRVAGAALGTNVVIPLVKKMKELSK